MADELLRYQPELVGVARPESVRLWLALGILGLMAIDLIALLVLVILGTVPIDDLATVTTALLAPVVGLAGTAIGFYFSSTTEAASENGKALD